MHIACSVLVLLLGAFLSQEAARPASVDPSTEFFKKGQIPRLRIQISDAELEKLRADNRAYVRCTIQENKTIYKDVAIKLKGAAGSFREFDDRPALTLNADKFTKGQTFHGLDKFHLNNSVQDETCLHEWLSEELCRAAGIPATRVTHARVWLNDRDVGLYVLKEGFDQTFLSRHFEDTTGNLYDGGFVQDIDTDLEKDAGNGPDDHSDLRALLDACREPDIETRWKRIEEHLDVEAFISFMAFELMACHWDGYTQNRNNYRIYFNPTDQKARFLPHGMDQIFGDPNASVLDPPGAIVASTVMLNPAWRKRYRERLSELLPLFDPPTKLHQRVDAMRRRLLPALHGMDPQRSRDHADHVRDLKERLAARAVSLREQVPSRTIRGLPNSMRMATCLCPTGTEFRKPRMRWSKKSIWNKGKRGIPSSAVPVAIVSPHGVVAFCSRREPTRCMRMRRPTMSPHWPTSEEAERACEFLANCEQTSVRELPIGSRWNSNSRLTRKLAKSNSWQS